jgi:hypothetical protein
MLTSPTRLKGRFRYAILRNSKRSFGGSDDAARKHALNWWRLELGLRYQTQTATAQSNYDQARLINTILDAEERLNIMPLRFRCGDDVSKQVYVTAVLRQEINESLYAEGTAVCRALSRLRWSWLTAGNLGECSTAYISDIDRVTIKRKCNILPPWQVFQKLEERKKTIYKLCQYLWWWVG